MARDDMDELLLKQDLLRLLTDNLPDMLWIKDLEGRYLFANKALCDHLLMARDTEEPIGKTDLFFAARERARHPEDPDWHTFGEVCRNSDQVTAEANRPMRFEEWGNVRGKPLYLEVHKAPFYDEQGRMLGVLGSGRDITEEVQLRKKLETQRNELEYQARHDLLTGLANRNHFQEALRAALQRSRRSGLGVAVLFIDLDGFKNINDIYGHDIGDRLLQLMARRLTSVIREVDTLARLGGDEFTLIVECVRHPRDLEILAEKLLQAIRRPLTLDDVTHRMTASIGISLNDQKGIDCQTMLRHADAAMYRAKEKGRDRFEFYTSRLTEQALRRLVLENELRNALEEGRFVLHYQPRIALESGRICGAEVLVRWRHPRQGIIGPERFVEIAEHIGLIAELDRWVYRNGLTQLQRWRSQGLVSDDFRMAFNLSVRHLEQEDFLERFLALVRDCDVDPGAIELEITETRLLGNLQTSRNLLSRLKRLGVHLAIDDFGTGYASFAYLKRLQFDTLKIDRSFVRDLPDSEQDGAIVRAILGIGRALGLEVVAEGVESLPQRDFLRAEGCPYAQGFLFDRPQPADVLESRLRRLAARPPWASRRKGRR